MNNPVKDLVERKAAIRTVKPTALLRERLAANAAALSRKNYLTKCVAIINDALFRLIQLAYEQNAAGSLCNVDPVSHRLRIPAPFGSKGWREWGLRQWEARALSAILRRRQAEFEADKQRPPLFFYDPDTNYWAVNIFDYESIQQAQWWLEKSPITVSEWDSYINGLPRRAPRKRHNKGKGAKRKSRGTARGAAGS